MHSRSRREMLWNSGIKEEQWPNMQSPDPSSFTRQPALTFKAAHTTVQGGSCCNVADVPAYHASDRNAMQRDVAEAWYPAAATAAELQQHFTGHAGRMTIADVAAAIEQLGLAEDVTPAHIINWWNYAGHAQQQQQQQQHQQSSVAADTAEDQPPCSRRRKRRHGGVRRPGASAAGSSSETCERAWYERLPEARQAFKQAAEECGCGSEAGCDAQQFIDYMKRGGETGSNKSWPGLVDAAKLSARDCSDLLLDIRRFLLSSKLEPIDLKSRSEDRSYLISFSAGGIATG